MTRDTDDTPGPDHTRGAIFAVSGLRYNILARRAALTLRQTMPGLAIDIFTDAPTWHAARSEAFDEVHALEDVFHRPKMEGLRRSRFDRTLCLDADVIVLTDVSDVFDILDRADIAMALEMTRLAKAAVTQYGTPRLPNAVPGYNSGVIAMRSSPAVRDLVTEWHRLVRDTAAKHDQPILRRLLWESDLRVATLTRDYNEMYAGRMTERTRGMTAPRIIHSPTLYREPRFQLKPDAPFHVPSLLGYENARALQARIDADVTYPGQPAIPIWSGPRAAPVQSIIDRVPKRLRRFLNERIRPSAPRG